jgi:hypothetical protein
MRSAATKPIVICVAEDRKAYEPALRLLLTSLCRYSTNIQVTVFYPAADQAFLDWARSLAGKIAVRAAPISGAYGWNVKPYALLQLLNEGNHEVIWLDSDILTTKDICPTFSGLSSNVIVATEEALWFHNEGDAVRARRWGFPVKRKFSFPLNTAVLRVTQDHIPLLAKWKSLLELPIYKQVQQLPLAERPLHMVGDQDVLTALLSSEEFHTIPVRILYRGTGIIQYLWVLGFTVAERIGCIAKGMPPFIHSQGAHKPWLPRDGTVPKNLRLRMCFAYEDMSPYIVIAEKLAPDLTCHWPRPRSRFSFIFRKLGLEKPALVGLPLAILFDAERFCKAIVKRILDRYYPEAIFAVRALRYRRHFRDAFFKRQSEVKTKLYNGSDPAVLSGPFVGMKYINEVVWGPIEPKWLGTYEQELHSLVQRILETNYANIIDVGSAEGYYAVGLATKFPQAKVYSYDTDPWARRQQRRLANLNNVKNLQIGGFCTDKHLSDRIKDRSLLVCDIEGSEYDLLDPQKTPALRKCDILVELHERREYGFTPRSGADELSRRFFASHRHTIVSVATRSGSQLADIIRARLSARELADCMDEHRSPNQLWLWLEVQEQQAQNRN